VFQLTENLRNIFFGLIKKEIYRNHPPPPNISAPGRYRGRKIEYECVSTYGES
jgi:hypothetical protein